MHNHFILVLIILFIIVEDHWVEAGLLQPCHLYKMSSERVIDCYGDKDIDLKVILSNFSKTLNNSEKHFKQFYLNNTSIKVLEEYTFNDLTFDEIIIKDCNSLTIIDKKAFNSTDMITKILQIQNCPKLISPDNSIFEVMSKFILVETIYFLFNGIKEIPSNAFQPKNGYQRNLRNLYIDGNITKIGSKAFYNLPNVTQIIFNNAGI